MAAQRLAASARHRGGRDHVAEIVASSAAPAPPAEVTAAVDRQLRRFRTSLGPQSFVHPDLGNWPTHQTMPDGTFRRIEGTHPGNVLQQIADEHGVPAGHVVDRARAAGFEVRSEPRVDRKDPLVGHVPSVDEAATARVVDGAAYRGAFEAAFAGSEFTGHVTHYSAGELDGMTAMLTTDGLSGVAIHDHGDGRVEGTALFSAPGATKGTGLALLRRAIEEHGVNYVECFGPKLPELYKLLGFEVVEEFPFDEEQAPSGWNFARFGRPPYYTMRLPGKLPGVGEKKDAGEVTPMPTDREMDEVLDAPVPAGIGGDADAHRDAALAVIGGLPADDAE